MDATTLVHARPGPFMGLWPSGVSSVDLMESAEE